MVDDGNSTEEEYDNYIINDDLNTMDNEDNIINDELNNMIANDGNPSPPRPTMNATTTASTSTPAGFCGQESRRSTAPRPSQK